MRLAAVPSVVIMFVLLLPLLALLMIAPLYDYVIDDCYIVLVFTNKID